MEYLVGVVLSLAVAAFAALSSFDRDRAFYPTVLIVVASYYVLFAAMGASTTVLTLETLPTIGFATVAVLGFKKSPWFAAIGIAGHGVFDSVHHLLITNPGVPRWWPGFCLSFDIALGCLLVLRLMLSRGREDKGGSA